MEHFLKLQPGENPTEPQLVLSSTAALQGFLFVKQIYKAFSTAGSPGQSRYTTKRNEGDKVEILSGIFEGKTTGTPISLIVRNEDQISRDYGNIKDCYRPGHADYTFSEKYGFRDYRGGGRSSGRETIGRVAARCCCFPDFTAVGY